MERVQGWLTGDVELAAALIEQAGWEQRSRWMYTWTVEEPRLTAEFPVIADAPQPVLHYLAEVLSAHYRRPPALAQKGLPGQDWWRSGATRGLATNVKRA